MMILSEFSSILLYLACFGMCIGLAVLYQRKLENMVLEESASKKRIVYFWKRMAIATIIAMPIILLASLRADSVGVDTKEYSRYFYTYCEQYPDFFSYFKYRKEDVLYSLISVLVYRFTGTVHLLYFIMQFLTIVPIIYVGTKKVKYIHLWKILSVYCFWFFNDSLNANRQYAAVGLLFFACDLYFSNKKMKAIIPFLMSAGIHFSAIMFGPFLLAMYHMLKSKNVKTWKIIMPVIAVALLLFGRYGFQMLYSWGVLPYRYVLYIDTFIRGGGSVESVSWSIINIRTILFCLIRIVITILLYYTSFKKSITKNADKDQIDYKYIYFLNTLLYVGGVIILHTSYVIRVTIYLDFFVIMVLPYLDNCSRIKVGNKKTLYSFWLSLIYWFFHTYFLGESATIPFEFRE